MSVISTMEATPNRVGILYRFLNAQSVPLSQDDLVALLSPPSLQPKKGSDDDEKEKGSVLAPKTLAECKALGLVESGPEAGTLQVPVALRGLDQAGLLGLLEKRLTDPVVAADCGQEKVPYALAWFLSQSPANPLAFRDNQAGVIEAEIGGRSLDLSNYSRFQQLSYWIQYLGLGWQVPTESAGVELVSDPTEALERHLEAILAAERELPIREAIEALGHRLPILETGSVRQDVESWMPDDKRRSENDLSASTSLALVRLELRGVLGLEDPSDATAMRLLTWPSTRRVSHLVWKKPSRR
jgi:hypothetical protein